MPPRPDQPNPWTRMEASILAGILGLASVLRLVALGSQGLWTDEASTVVIARLPLPQLLDQLRRDVQAPLYYLLEKVSLDMFGDGEGGARVLSALTGIGAVALAHLAGRRLVSAGAGLAAAGLLAISPLHVHYSREARNYALMALLVLAVLLALDALVRRPTLLRCLAAAASMSALLLTHAAAPFVGAPLALGAAVLAWRSPVRWTVIRSGALAAALVVLAMAPWMAATFEQGGHAGVAYGWARPVFDADFPWQIPLSLAALSSGTEPPERNVVWETGASAWSALGVALVLAGSGLAAARRWRRPDAAMLVAGGVVLPLAGFFAFSLLRFPVYLVGRVDAPLVGLFSVLVGAGVVGLPRRAAALALGACALLAAPEVAKVLRVDTRSHERELVRIVADGAEPGDAIIVTGPSRHLFEYYLGRLEPSMSIWSWPPGLAEHPSWFDWSSVDVAALESQSEALTREVLAAVRRAGGRRAWVAWQDCPDNQPLRLRLEAEAVPVSRIDTGQYVSYLVFELRP